MVFSFQAKSLVADEDILITQAGDDVRNPVFSAHATRSTNDGEKTDTTRMIPSSSGIASLPSKDSSSSSQLAADAGILFSAHARSSVEDGEDTVTTTYPRRSRSAPPLPYNAPLYQHAAADAGILFSLHSRMDENTENSMQTASARSLARLLPKARIMLSQQQSTACGENGYVDCFNGRSIYYYARTRSWYYDGYVTCREACNGACCISNTTTPPLNYMYQACDLFTGRVCKDGSCNGEFACYRANIQLVANSCIGNGACCEQFGYEGGVSGSIINSCRGFNTCQLIGSRAQDGGQVRNIINSCLGQMACVRLGMFGSFQGDVINSCTGYQACFSLGYNGTINGAVANSCNHDFACEKLADGGGEVANVASSCNAEWACRGAGSIYCNNTANFTCLEYDGGGIKTNMNNCCNEMVTNVCYFMREETLPQQCRSSLMVRSRVRCVFLLVFNNEIYLP